MTLVPFNHEVLGKSVAYYNGHYVTYVNLETGKKFEINVEGVFTISNSHMNCPQYFTLKEIEAVLEVHKLLEKESQENGN